MGDSTASIAWTPSAVAHALPARHAHGEPGSSHHLGLPEGVVLQPEGHQSSGCCRTPLDCSAVSVPAERESRKAVAEESPSTTPDRLRAAARGPASTVWMCLAGGGRLIPAVA